MSKVILRPYQNDDGTFSEDLLDEVVIHESGFHIEQMDNHAFWLALDIPGGGHISFDLYWNNQTKNLELTVQDFDEDVEFRE